MNVHSVECVFCAVTQSKGSHSLFNSPHGKALFFRVDGEKVHNFFLFFAAWLCRCPLVCVISRHIIDKSSVFLYIQILIPLMNAKELLETLKARFPNEPEYHQAVEEVLFTLEEEYNKHPEFEKVQPHGAPVHPRAHPHFPRDVDRRPRQCAHQHGLSRATQQRHRPLQGRYSFPQLRQLGHSQVLGLRTNVQKCADHPPHGRSQRRI